MDSGVALFDGGDVVFLGGLAIASYGVSMWSIAAALVAGGGIMMAIAIMPMLVAFPEFGGHDMAIKVGDSVESSGDLSRDSGVVIKIDDDSEFCLVAFRLAGEVAVKRSRLHLVGPTTMYTTRASIGTNYENG